MAITTAEYKAAIEAKIAAYDSSTPLTTLAVTKSNADLWLANNSGGSITGYSTLEGLIQTKQNALVVSSPLTDISLVGTSAFVPATGGGGVFKLRSRIIGAISPGVTGDILTLTAPAGQIARLVFLEATSYRETGISIVNDGTTCISGGLETSLSVLAGGASFVISETAITRDYATAGGATYQKTASQVVGSVIKVVKDAGSNTTSGLRYTVEYGVIE